MWGKEGDVERVVLDQMLVGGDKPRMGRLGATCLPMIPMQAIEGMVGVAIIVAISW